MSPVHSERVLRITRRFWFGPASTHELYENPMVGRALHLLTNEFLDALALGPDALVSTPDSVRQHEASIVDILRALFVAPESWRELLVELSESDGNARLKLAEMYAQWVVSVYAAKGAFDGHVHRIAAPQDDQPLPPSL